MDEQLYTQCLNSRKWNDIIECEETEEKDKK